MTAITDHEITTPMLQSIRIVYLCEERDNAARQRLEAHLDQLRRQKHIESWSRQHIAPGSAISEEAERNLQQADLFLILISADFLASDLSNEELSRALERRKRGAQIIPILVRPADWEANAVLRNLQPLPMDRIPILEKADQEAAWRDVAVAIRQCVSKLRAVGQQPAQDQGTRLAALAVASEADYQRRELRRLIVALLPLTSDLVQFCEFHFPEVVPLFVRELDRMQKIDLLLDRVGELEVRKKLESQSI